MPPVSLYWFAAQQQTSTVRPQKYGCFYVKFSAESNGFGLFFLKQQEVAKKWLRRKQSVKPPDGVVRRLRVNYFVHQLNIFIYIYLECMYLLVKTSGAQNIWVYLELPQLTFQNLKPFFHSSKSLPYFSLVTKMSRVSYFS